MIVQNNVGFNLRPAKTEGASAASDVDRAEGAPPDSGTSEVSSHVQSQELRNLFGLVRQQPEVRPEVLQKIFQRLANGSYLTPEAAAGAADSLLGNGS
jgi:hypothetical protein